MTISAVIFDMDGLMFDSERIGLDAFIESAQMHGYTDTKGTFLKMIGRNVRDSNDILLQDFGPDFPVEAVRNGRKDILDALRSTSGMPAKQGLYELLAFLHHRGFPMAVASSSDRSVVMENITSHKLESFFQTYVCGDEVTNGKPDPEIFLTTAEKLSVLPQECMVLEDSESGIRAAYAAGMIPVLIPDIKIPPEEIQAIAYATVKSLLDVPELLTI